MSILSNKQQDMTKSEFMALCESRWEEIDELSVKTNLYDLEKDFSQVWQQLGTCVFERRLGDLPTNHRKKKPKQHLGESSNK